MFFAGFISGSCYFTTYWRPLDWRTRTTVSRRFDLKCFRVSLRANVGKYRESQISSEKSNFGLYHPNNPLVWLFQKMILKNPQALCIWIILEKFENSQKNTIFIHEISHNFERFQRNSKYNCKYNSWPSLLTHDVHGVLNVKITPNFSRAKSILVCFTLKNQIYCMKEQVLYLQKLKFQLCKLKRWYEMKF